MQNNPEHATDPTTQVEPPTTVAPQRSSRLAAKVQTSLTTQDLYAYLALFTTTTEPDYSHVPGTYAEVMLRPDLWVPAIQDELQVMEKWKVWTLVPENKVPAGKKIDFVSAYLNSVPEFQVYMDMPLGFSGGEGKKLKLQKMMYGLMQGGQDWFWTLDNAYKELGYNTSQANLSGDFHLISILGHILRHPPGPLELALDLQDSF
ncbi:hypothetical protein C0993_001061 [Termitomyces sp. T159_Od127]|nr:hypothetical protein C0993_001061 [Termitomyces sp. T159_Od127]